MIVENFAGREPAKAAVRRTCMSWSSRRVAFAASALAVAPLAVPAPARALDCVDPGTVIADAAQVFVGRIVDAADGRVRVEVDEIWKGAPVEGVLWMDVDLPYWTEWARGGDEIPDGYNSSKQWVFAPTGDTISPCSSWVPTIVDEHSPAEPLRPVGNGSVDDAVEARGRNDDDGTAQVAAGVGLGVGAVAVGVVLLVLRRRSPRRRSRRPRR